MVVLFLFFVALALATPCISAERRETGDERPLPADGVTAVSSAKPASDATGPVVLCAAGTNPSADGLFHLPATRQRCIPGVVEQKALQMH
ncbi:hypothetical protein [Martelella sp. HB161492]|uniref:hypothetical protein n=1 Tax=Martelella sp. HB161492 TaxID=2720726 RepID=UPI001590D4E2|nr:hypothetical protein [Martelella sp. HB161492]